MSPFSWAAAEPSDTPLADAYAACARAARRHDERFQVTSRLLPPAMRPHVAAIQAFARGASAFADTGEHSDTERECLLDDWLHRLRAAARDESGDDPASIFAAIGHTIRTHRLPVQLFEDLIGAFRQDVLVKRYAAWDDLIDYCRRAANPVGRLMLRVGGLDDPELDRASDDLCTAVRLATLWQEVARDWKTGRLYVPREILDACGARESDLDAGSANPAWRAALVEAARRTRGLFAHGRRLGDRLTGRLGFERRVEWAAGSLALARLERAGYDVFGPSPAVRSVDTPLLLWRAWRWQPSN